MLTSKNEKERHLAEWIIRYRFIRNHTPEKLTEKQIQLIDRIDVEKTQKKEEQWLTNYENGFSTGVWHNGSPEKTRLNTN